MYSDKKHERKPCDRGESLGVTDGRESNVSDRRKSPVNDSWDSRGKVRRDDSQGSESHCGDRSIQTKEREPRGGVDKEDASRVFGKKSHVETERDNLREKNSQCVDKKKDMEYFEDDGSFKDGKLHCREGERKHEIKPELVMEAPMPGFWEPTENTDVPSWDADALLEEPRPEGWLPPTPERVPISLLDFKKKFASEIFQPPRMEIGDMETILRKYRDVDEKEPLVLFDHECVIRTNLRGIMESKKRREKEELEDEREYRIKSGGFRGRGGFGGRGRCGGSRGGSRGGFHRGRQDEGGNPNQLPVGQRRRFGDDQHQQPKDRRTEGIPPSPRVRRPPSPMERRAASPRERRQPSPSARSTPAHPRHHVSKESSSQSYKTRTEVSSHSHSRRSEVDPRYNSHAAPSKSSPSHGQGPPPPSTGRSSGTSETPALTYKQWKEQRDGKLKSSS